MLNAEERRFSIVFAVVMTLVAFALAAVFRFADWGFRPLVVFAAPIAGVAAYWASSNDVREQLLRKQAALVAVPYIAAVPLAALADLLAAPSHVYFSALGIYLLMGLILVPGAVLIGVLFPKNL